MKAVLQLDKYVAKWTTLVKKSSVAFTKVTLEQIVTFLLSNCFLKLENKIFQQVIRIPVGSDPDPYFSVFFSVL